MRPSPRPRWQQATALVSLGAGGVVTGLSFVPRSPAELTSPATLPLALMALEKSAQSVPTDDAMLRSAIVHVAKHFLRLAERNSPADMEALIWRHASLDGADHGPSCAAFASLTLELGSHVAGQQSWVTGGTTYPWPLHSWADARVDPNPDSPNVMSVLQDAQDHHRWHPLGDGYLPQPGDWVLFDGHVEVVTGYAGGVLETIGGDSLPNYSVNAHSYPGPLSGQGVAGFVDNGLQPTAAAPSATLGAAPSAPSSQTGQPQGAQAAAKPQSVAKPAGPAAAAPEPATAADASTGPATPFEVLAPRAIPAPRAAPQSPFVRSHALAESGAKPPKAGAVQQAAPRARTQGTAPVARTPPQPPRDARRAAGGTGQWPNLVQGQKSANLVHGQKSGNADIPATSPRPPMAPRARPGQAEIPGLLAPAPRRAASAGEPAPYRRHQPAPTAQSPMPGSALQRAFIEQVAPGAVAAQRKYGVPASVTIAQAIDESGWGQSILATQDRNLFGIKGTGPGGSDLLPTQEFAGGQLVSTTAPFRVYHDVAQSIDAHGKLLARSEYYTNAMANRNQPNAFADALTGVYATDPGYGAKLIGLMQQYDLYRFDVAAHVGSSSRNAPGNAAIPGITGHAAAGQSYAAGPASHMRAASPASGQAAALANRTPGSARTPNPAPTSPAGRDRRAAHGAPAARAPRPGYHGGAARPSGDASSAGAGWPPGSDIPGTWQAGPPARRPNAGAERTVPAGQADIPGLPGTAAPMSHPEHRTRSGSRLQPMHPPADGQQPSHAQPAGGAPADGRYRGNPAPLMPVARTPHEAGATGRAWPAPAHHGGLPGGTVPGLGDAAYGQPAGTPSADLGELAIPGLPMDSASPVGRTNAHDSTEQDGAWIPGLPGQGSGTAGHDGHHIGAARQGEGPAGHYGHHIGAARRGAAAAHGTNLAPTRARRFASGARPSASAGHRAASAQRAPTSRSSSVPPPVPDVAGAAAPAAPRHTHGSAVRRPASARGPAAPAATPPHGSTVIARPLDAAPAPSSVVAAGPARTPSRSRPAAPAPAPSAAAGPQPGPGAAIPSQTQAPPTPVPVPSPARGAGTTLGAGRPIRATTTAVTAVRYSRHLPLPVGKAYVTSAKVPLVRSEPLYTDVAAQSGIPWEVLAACDWMQCSAKAGLSPVYGEKLGAVNPDGTRYRTRSAALERCAYDLVELARSVYQIDLTRSEPLSVRELAKVFAAFRWGGLLKAHHTSAMEFPYSVAGLTTQHMHMRWPDIDDPQAPDKPGARFHKPFGAVPVVLSLNYPATA